MSLPCRLVLLGFVFTFGGCETYRTPQIQVANAAPAELTAEAMKLNLLINLQNPNKESLELIEFEYEVEIDGKKVYEGRRAAQATLAPHDARSITIPAVVQFADVAWSTQSVPASAEYRVKGTLKYLTPGQIAQILLDVGVRRPKARFKGAGHLQVTAQ